MSDFTDQLTEWMRAFAGPANDLIDKVQAVDPTLRAFVAGLAALLETNIVTGLIVPGDTVMLVASAAVKTPPEGILLGICMSVGALTGEIAGYGLGRWVGPRARGRWLRRRAGEERIGPVGRMLQRRGGPWILASRFIPVLRTVTPFVVGLNAFPFKRFLAWSAPACVLWSAVYVTVYSLTARSLRDDTGSPVLGAALAALSALLFGGAVLAQFLVERWYRRRSGATDALERTWHARPHPSRAAPDDRKGCGR